jgi:hypothetical protein
VNDDKLDKSLEELGFTTLDENEEETLKHPVPQTPPMPEPVSDAEMASIRAQIIEILDTLPPPLETNFWETELSDMQAQLRTCLINEIVDRYIFGAKLPVFRVIRRSSDDEDIDTALVFPVTLAMIVYSALDNIRLVDDEPPAILETLLMDDETLRTQSFSKLVEQIDTLDGYTCEMIHPHVNRSLDNLSIDALQPLMSSRQIAEAKVLAREVLLRVYALSLPHIFRRRVRNGDIMDMVETVVMLTFAVNKAVGDALDDA